MAANVTIEGLEELEATLERLKASNPKMDKQMKTLIRTVLMKARRELTSTAKSALKNDPRQAYRAVKSTVYRKILGGNVSILTRRKNNGKMYVGGSHRRARSSRTEALDSYFGSDRGFVLRFLNAGTAQRQVTTMDNHSIERSTRPGGKRTYKGGIGNRGAISASNWFAPASTLAVEKAADEFSELVDRAIEEVWSQNNK